ncbi:MAG: hypothetical protein IPM02_26400 [Betaproteobacteria bacterium]|nr:hypothetical protein [Betaproteobacteria bacterium]
MVKSYPAPGNPPPAAAPPPDYGGLVAAIDALLAAGVRDEAARMLDRFGADLIRAGHPAAVERLQEALRGGRGQDSPAALLLQARALAQRSAAEAPDAFRAAYAASVAAGDEYAAIQAASGLLRAVFTIWNDFRPVAAMVAVVEPAIDRPVRHPDPTQELECLAGLLAGQLMLRSLHPRRVQLFERVVALAMDERVHPAVRLGAGGILLAYCQLWNEFSRGAALIGALDALREDRAIGLEQRLVWRFEAALLLIASPQRDDTACAARIAELAAAIPEEGFQLLRFLVGRLRFEHEALRRNFAACEAALAAMRLALDPRLAVQAITLAHNEARLAMALGQFERAAQASAGAVARAREVHVLDALIAMYRQIGALARGYAGDVEGARTEIEDLMRDDVAAHQALYRLSLETVYVAAAFAGGDLPAMCAAVEALLAAVERTSRAAVFTLHPRLGAQAMALALARGIRPETARGVVAFMKFAPPDDLPEAWPWTVRISLLGAPSVLVDGAPVGGKGKAQQRPLELLRALAIGGAGTPEGADIQALMFALWPEADADVKVSFDVNLLRLRKLLVHDGLIAVADGRVRLDTGRVWCDVLAFESRLAAPSASPWAGDPLTIYRGPLFGDDQVPPWAVSARERLRGRFLRAVASRGSEAEAGARWSEAIAIYERGLEQDNLAEEFYRGVMRCHLAQGDAAAALRAYRRCRELLSIVLGVQPSPQTQALYQSGSE